MMKNKSGSKGLKDEMQEEVNSVESLYMQFTNSKNSIDKRIINVFCFFEGEDYKYYSSRVNMALNGDSQVHSVKCGNKKNVIRMFNKIKKKSKIRDEKLLFFVDKDFDDNSEVDKEIYITPCYAIENFYINDRVISDFISGELGIGVVSNKIDKQDYLNAIDYCKNERSKFIEDIALLNAWYSLQRKKSIQSKADINLNKLKFRSDLPKEITLEVLKDNTENYCEVDELELVKEQKRLMKDALNLFRGKYFIEFLHKTLEHLTSESAKNEKIFYKRRKVTYTIGNKNIITLLSQYAQTPECLKIYLNKKLIDNESKVIS